jgi:hypothetical protein
MPSRRPTRRFSKSQEQQNFRNLMKMKLGYIFLLSRRSVKSEPIEAGSVGG